MSLSYVNIYHKNFLSGGLLKVIVLCCVVLCCAVLCCAVLCCAVLCCAVLCCAVLCCAVLCCAVLCCAVLCCAVLCCAVLCCAVLCCAVLCCAVLYCIVLYCIVLYCIVLYGKCKCGLTPDRTTPQGPRAQPAAAVGRPPGGSGRLHQHPRGHPQLRLSDRRQRADEAQWLHGPTHGGRRRLDAARQLPRRQRRMRERAQSFRSDTAPPGGAIRLRRRREDSHRQGRVRRLHRRAHAHAAPPGGRTRSPHDGAAALEAARVSECRGHGRSAASAPRADRRPCGDDGRVAELRGECRPAGRRRQHGAPRRRLQL